MVPIILLLPTIGWGQQSFMDGLATIKKNKNATPAEVVALVTNPEFALELNAKGKSGHKNLIQVIDLFIEQSARHWVVQSQLDTIFAAFAGQGVDFIYSGKGSISNMLLTKYVYNRTYQYQNLGLLIFEELLLIGLDPFAVPVKSTYSMFTFAVGQIDYTSFYLDRIIAKYNFNTHVTPLQASPFMWLASYANRQGLNSLKHVILYDTDLDINERAENGKTSAFDRAIATGNTALAEVLIAGGINLLALCEACAAENYLHRIALYDSMEIFRILPNEVIEKLINQRDANGKTPIFWALENGQAQLAIAFTEAGADLTIVDASGLSVMNVAYLNAEANRPFLKVAGER